MADSTSGKAIEEGVSSGALAATVALGFLPPTQAAAVGAAVTLAAGMSKAIRAWFRKRKARKMRRRADDMVGL